MSKRLFFVASALPLALLAPVGAHAADSDAIEEIVVTARFREESAQDVPLAISAFSAEQMDRALIDTTFDLQYHTPGLFIQQGISGSSGASLEIRGQSASDTLLTTDSSVGVYVDSISIPRFLGLDTSLFDIERVEVLKGPQGTLFGRNTTGGAVSFVTAKPDYDGVHGYVDADGATFDTFTIGAALNIPLVDGRSALRLATKMRTSGGWDKSAGDGGNISDDEERFVRASLRLDPSDNVNVQVSGEAQTFENEGAPYISVDIGNALVAGNAALEGLVPPSRDSVFGGGQDIQSYSTGFNAGGLTAPDIENWNKFDRHAITGAVSVDFDDLTFKSISGFHNFTSSRSLDLDGTRTSGFQALLRTRADFYSQEFQLLGNALDNRLDWVVGAYWSREDGNEYSESYLAGTLGAALSPIGIPAPVFDGHVENESWALFTQGNYNFTDQLRLTLGFRYTDESKSLDSANRTIVGLTGDVVACSVPDGTVDDCKYGTNDGFDGNAWLVSLDYRVNDDVLVYIRSAEGFKGGGQNLRGTAQILTFSPVAEETATDVEVGIKGDFFDDELQLNADVWYTWYDDIQRSANVQVNGAFATIVKNAAKANMQGVELSATWIATERLSFIVNANYFDGEYEEWDDLDALGDPVDRSDTPFTSPDYAYGISGRWDQPTSYGFVSANVDYYWQDEVMLEADANYALSPSDPNFQDPDLVTQESYGLLNARIALETDYGLEFSLFGKNLTDEEYLVALTDSSRTALGTITALVGPPRIIGVGVKKSFGE